MVACEDEETQAGPPGPAAAAADVPPEVAQGLERSLEYLAGVLLEERHYSRLHASFASKWDRNQSLQAAVKLMEQYGVQMTPEDEEELGRMDEEAMIDTLVCKMPNQSKEEFQSFFMQLQLVVSTAARVRQALEDCDVAEGDNGTGPAWAAAAMMIAYGFMAWWYFVCWMCGQCCFAGAEKLESRGKSAVGAGASAPARQQEPEVMGVACA